jgi:hypothetical protein
MLDQLDRYYREQGISALDFKCKHRQECSEKCKPGQMVSVPESYVGMEYEAGPEAGLLPRLLFVSSDTNDPGWLKDNPQFGTLREGRNIAWRDRNASWNQKPQGHWHQTIALARMLLAPYATARLGRVIEFNDFVGYIAHVRSTRCKSLSDGPEEGNPRMFGNCMGFLKGEIEVLRPDIIVTQGTRARKALWNMFQTSNGPVPMPGNPRHKAFYEIGQFSSGHNAIKIVAWHPCAHWTGNDKQLFTAWAAKIVQEFIPVA